MSSEIESNTVVPESTAKLIANMQNTYVEVMLVRVGQEVIGMPVVDVSEVVHHQALTPVPMAPDHLLGVCNIHGQVVCVIDACQVMSLPYADTKNDKSVRLIVLNHPKMHIAIRADEILSVESIAEDVFTQATQNSKGFFYESVRIKEQDHRILRTEVLFK